MCQRVVVGTQMVWNLAGLLDTGLIRAEHIPRDTELSRAGWDIRQVCFCCVDVEEVLAAARVGFTLDEDWGDVIVAPPARYLNVA